LPGDELAFASVKFRVHLGPDEPGGGDDAEERTEMLSSVSGVRAEELEFFEDRSSASDVRLANEDSEL
jgi:hypothetical protein